MTISGFRKIKSPLMPSGAGWSGTGSAAAQGRLLEEMERRGDFSKVQICPTSAGEVVDEAEAKLVILSPAYSHRIVV